MDAFLVLFPVATSIYLLRNRGKLDSQNFKNRFGEVVLDLRIGERMAVLYQVFFMARRMAYAFILINFLDRSYLQIQLVIVAICLPTLIYVGGFRPFQTKMKNRVDLVNEVFTTLCSYSLVTFSDFVPDKPTKYDSGWSIVGAVFFLMLFNLTAITIESLVNLFYKLKLRWLRRKARKMAATQQHKR